MQSRLRSAAVICSVLVCVLSAWGGPNKDASVVVDQNAATEEMESVCAHNGIPSTVVVAVKVKDAVRLGGFCVRLAFDSTVLRYEKTELTVPGSGATPLLETNGGVPGPVIAKPLDAGTIDIATAIKSGRDVGVSGDGLLAHVTLTRIGDDDCSLSIAKAELSDEKHTIDLIIGE